MPKNKGSSFPLSKEAKSGLLALGKGGKNRRRGKNENEMKRELVFKEDGQGTT